MSALELIKDLDIIVAELYTTVHTKMLSQLFLTIFLITLKATTTIQQAAFSSQISLQTLSHFFNQFDAYQTRIFQEWEYLYIFPDVDKSAFEQIHLENEKSYTFQEKGNEQIQLQFLLDEIEYDEQMRFLAKSVLPAESLYMTKRVSVALEKNLIQLADTKDVQYSAGQTFDMIFHGVTEDELRRKHKKQTIVDQRLLQSGLKTLGITLRSDSDYLEMIQYFIMNLSEPGFTKIQFSQGMKRWNQKVRQQNLNQPILQNNVSFNPLNQFMIPMPDQYRQPIEYQNWLIQKQQFERIMGQANQFQQQNQQDNGWGQDNNLPKQFILDYRLNCTRACQNPNLVPPAGFRPHGADFEIDQIIKGCYVEGQLVIEHFAKFASNGQLNFNSFSNALRSLDITYANRLKEVFQEFDIGINGVVRSNFSAILLDNYIHFSTKKNLQTLHDEILISIEEKQLRDTNLSEQFYQQAGQGANFCNFLAFKNAIMQVGVQLSQTDLKFLAKKYSENDPDRINFLNLLKDVSNAPMLKQNVSSDPNNTEYIKLAIEAVRKRVHSKGNVNLTSLLNQSFQNRSISRHDFLNFFGTQMGLRSNVCTDRVLEEIYDSFYGAKEGRVSSSEISSYFDGKGGRNLNEMKQDLMRNISPKNMQQHFAQNEEYKRRKRVKLIDFIEALQMQFQLNKIDAEFLTSFYAHGSDVDVGKFISDCDNTIAMNKDQGFRGQLNQKNKLQFAPKQQELFDQLKKFLVREKVQLELARNLTKLSIGGTHFVSEVNLKSALNQVMQNKNQKGLVEHQIKLLTSILQKNDFNEYNWHQFLSLLFTEEEAHDLIGQSISAQNSQSKNLSKRQLNPEELKNCQQWLFEVRDEILSRNERPETFIERSRNSFEMPVMTPATFKRFLLDSCSKQLMKRLSNNELTLLVYYLVREESGKVSYKKLYEAFNQSNTDEPLKQDGIQSFQEREQQIESQLLHTKIPLEIIELNVFMKKTGKTVYDLFQVDDLKEFISVNDFEQKLHDIGYSPKELNKLIKAIQNQPTGSERVSLQMLYDQINEISKPQVNDPRVQAGLYGKVDKSIRQKLQQISDYLQQNDMSIDQFHAELDKNKDGNIDFSEFVDGLTSKAIGTLNREDLETIFKVIDINEDKTLSVNEISLFIQGAKLKRDQKRSRIDPEIQKEASKEIEEFFKYFDENESGFCTSDQIQKALQSVNSQITKEQIADLIKKVDSNGDGKLSQDEFKTLMNPWILDKYINDEEQIENMRALFKEADSDYSGYLTLDEFYVCLLKMGADITRQEVVQMFAEFDTSGDNKIDIDEFVTIMSTGAQFNFSNEANVQTVKNINSVGKLQRFEFLKALDKMPSSFTQSFFFYKYSKNSNLLSQEFKVQVDPKTLQFKDMKPVDNKLLTPEQMSRLEYKPRLQPIESLLGSQITIEEAEGVPLHSSIEEREKIVKRVVRVGLFDTVKRDLIYNSAHVVALYNKKQEDIWNFQKTEPASLNPILFRTTQDLNRTSILIIFELVVYMRVANKDTEMSCGWCSTPLATCEKEMTKVKLEIKGGSPLNALVIEKEDVRTNRSGFKSFVKLFNNNIKSTLMVSFKPLKNLEPETNQHLSMMPSTCFIQKKLLFLASGFRNYAAEKILSSSNVGILKKPSGNLVMSVFPKILDCPEIVELVAQIWAEDHLPTMTQESKRNIEFLMRKVEEFVSRIYPVLYNEGFDYKKEQPYLSVCFEPSKLNMRRNLLTSALRHNVEGGKHKVQAPENINAGYKPFNIAEIDFEVWDNKDSKIQKTIKELANKGVISM